MVWPLVKREDVRPTSKNIHAIPSNGEVLRELDTETRSYWFYWLALINNRRNKFIVGRDIASIPVNTTSREGVVRLLIKRNVKADSKGNYGWW